MFMANNNPQIHTFEEVDVLVENDKVFKIVLFNDDVNTFDYVIELLVEYCDHDYIQAEQCATLVHYKGRCDVKSGNYEELEPIASALLQKGLSVEIA
jgi:ATP-dependent Clp protease adaptor protein ClpS